MRWKTGGANGGGGEVTTKQVFKGGVDILDKPLDVESKATFGADVDVDGKLTINSASDLKTKDGTGFGLPSPWSADEKVLGLITEQYIKGLTIKNGISLAQANLETGDIAFLTPTVAKEKPLFIYASGNVESALFLPESFFQKNTTIDLGSINQKQDKLISGVNIKTINNVSVLGEGNISIETGTDWKDLGKIKYQGFASDGVAYGLFKYTSDGNDFLHYGFCSSDGSSTYGYFNYTPGYKQLFVFHNASVDSKIVLPNDFYSKSQVINLGDINTNKNEITKKQATLYRHTITIYEGNTQDGNSICFTTYTPSNTPIDSIQDLTASAGGSNKLANTDLECFGVSGTASALVFYNKIHVGTSITNTTLQKATGGSATLASVYASYTMKDDVTLN